MVQIHEMELVVGDVFHIGHKTVTVIDIENGEVTFRVDDGDPHDEDPIVDLEDVVTGPLPR